VEREVSMLRHSSVKPSNASPHRNDHLFHYEPSRRNLGSQDDLTLSLKRRQVNVFSPLRMLDCVIFVTVPALCRMMRAVPGRSATLPELNLEHWDSTAKYTRQSPLTYVGMYKRPKTQQPEPCPWLSRPRQPSTTHTSFRVLDNMSGGIVGSRCPDACIYVWRLNKSAFLSDLKSTTNEDSICMRLLLRCNGMEVSRQTFYPYDLNFATMWDKNHDAITTMGGDIWWNMPLAYPFMRRWECKSDAFRTQQEASNQFFKMMLAKRQQGDIDEVKEDSDDVSKSCSIISMADSLWPLVWNMLDDNDQVRLRYTNKELDRRLRFLCASLRWQTIHIELNPMSLQMPWSTAEKQACNARIRAMSQQAGPDAVYAVWIALSVPMVVARCNLRSPFSDSSELMGPSNIDLELLVPNPQFPMHRIALQYVGSKNLHIMRSRSDAGAHKQSARRDRRSRDPVPQFSTSLPLEPQGSTRYLFWKCTFTHKDYMDLLFNSLGLHLVFNAGRSYERHDPMDVLPIKWNQMQTAHLHLPWLTMVSGVTTNLLHPPASLEQPLVFHTMVLANDV
jgi:hypothetical protein